MKEKYEKLMSKLSVAVIGCIVFFFGSIIYCVHSSEMVQLKKDLDFKLTEAKSTGDPEEIQGYLKKLLKNMDVHGLTNDEYLATFVDMPEDSLKPMRMSISNMIERLERYKAMDKKSLEYIHGMTELRSELSKISNVSRSWYQRQHNILFLLQILSMFSAAIILIIMFGKSLDMQYC